MKTFIYLILCTALVVGCDEAARSSADMPSDGASNINNTADRSMDRLNDGRDQGTSEPEDGGLSVDDLGMNMVAQDQSVEDPVTEEVELPDDTTVLTLQEDGLEFASRTLNGLGTLRFYSERHRAYIEYQPVAMEGTPPLDTELECHITINAERRMSVFIFDVRGASMPVAIETELPETGEHALHIDPLDEIAMDSTYLPMQEMPSDPFGDFTVAGVSVSINISNAMRTYYAGAVSSAFASLVGGACNVIAPLHSEICSLISIVVEVLGNLIVPGVKLLKGVIGLGEFILQEALASEIAPFLCKEGTRFLMKGVHEEHLEEINALRDRYRRALSEYHYLLYLFETQPPLDPQEYERLRGGLAKIGASLSVVGPPLREGYVQIHNVENGQPSRPIYTQVRDVITEMITEVNFNRINWETIFHSTLTQAIFISDGERTLVGVEVAQLKVSKKTISELARLNKAVEIGGWIGECLIGVYTGIEGVVMHQNRMETRLLEMPIFYGEVINSMSIANQELYRVYFGGGEIPVECLFDEYEPNSTWRQALASPTLSEVGQGPTWLRDLTLCAVMGVPIDEDWYAFPMAPISFNVQARVRSPQNSSFAEEYTEGEDEELCVTVYYYGQSNEIIDAPPTELYGACGSVSDVWTGSRGIRRAIGEAWSYILVRVHAPQGIMDSIGYDLGFAE